MARRTFTAVAIFPDGPLVAGTGHDSDKARASLRTNISWTVGRGAWETALDKGLVKIYENLSRTVSNIRWGAAIGEIGTAWREGGPQEIYLMVTITASGQSPVVKPEGARTPLHNGTVTKPQAMRFFVEVGSENGWSAKTLVSIQIEWMELVS